MLKSMHRRNDPQSCVEAAKTILAKLPKLRRISLDAARRIHALNGGQGVTGRELEEWCTERFCGPGRYTPNSFRRRLTELRELGLVESTGKHRGKGEVFIPLTDEQFFERARLQSEGSLF